MLVFENSGGVRLLNESGVVIGGTELYPVYVKVASFSGELPSGDNLIGKVSLVSASGLDGCLKKRVYNTTSQVTVKSGAGVLYGLLYSNASPTTFGTVSEIPAPSTTSFSDTSKGWLVDQFASAYVLMTSGAQVGVARQITSNSSSGLVLSDAMTTPTSGDGYILSTYPAVSFGTVTTGGEDHEFTDSSKSWVPGQWVGGYAVITDGVNNENTGRQILANTTNKITCAPFAGVTTVADSYIIIPPSSSLGSITLADGSEVVQIVKVPGLTSGGFTSTTGIQFSTSILITLSNPLVDALALYV